MQNIRIYSKDETVGYTLPKVRAITVGGENVKKEIQMAAGNIVQYVQGFRPSITAEFDYFPAALLSQVISLIRQGGWFLVEYPDPSGQDKSGYFSITPSAMGVFCYRNGNPMWHGLTLTFVSREVER